MAKTVLMFLISLLCQHLIAQKSTEFEYWISDLDKAANERTTYHVTNSKIVVKKGHYNFIYFAKDYKQDKVVLRRKINSSSAKKMNGLGSLLVSDSLKDQYANLCIMDGMILTFQFEWGSLTKTTTLSNYYYAPMRPFVDFINERLPEKYKIYYDERELTIEMRNCDPRKILD